MKNLIIFFALLTQPFSLVAQRLEGVYFGKLISERNALLIKKVSQEDVVGSVYLNKDKKIDFTGKYTGHLLEISLPLQEGNLLVLQGRIERGKLIFHSLSRKSEEELMALYKVTSKANISIEDLFSEMHDPLLLGKWENIKSFSKNGEQRVSENKVSQEFDLNGLGLYQMKNLNMDIFKGNENSIRQEIRWSTERNELVIVFKLTDEMVRSTYSIKSDTLIIKDTGGAVSFYKRTL